MFAEDAFQSNIPVPLDITVAVVYSVFGICSLLGNSALLYVCYKKKHLLKPAEYFIINLAFSDLGLTLSLYPMAITSSVYHRWLFGQTLCYLYAFCGMLFGLCSLTTLTLLSVVCFLKVCHPLCGNRFQSHHGLMLVASAWFYALFFACSPLAHWGEYGPEPYGTACCIDWRLSNQLTAARSYTVALFVLCYILPCCVIVASYAGILITVQASRKTMEQHTSKHAKMSCIQTIIIKLSVAVCIGFFAAWSPYAAVSMWATFGQIEDIPPLAFAMPAMFAKSSTIYNPIIYLTLRPNFRRRVYRDLGNLLQTCVKSCHCPKGHRKCCSAPGIRRRPICKSTNQFPLSISPTEPPIAALKDHCCHECQEGFERFPHFPQMCGVTNPALNGYMATDQDAALSHIHNTFKKSLMAKVNTSETNNFNINFEMIPVAIKEAWP